MRIRDTIVVAVLIACQIESPLPSPEISSVEPTSGPYDLETSIVINGRHFYLDVTSAPDGTGLTAHREFAVSLGGRSLRDVEQVDSTKLLARVPAGMTPGHYALHIETPTGSAAVKIDAFEVTIPPFPALFAELTATPTRVSRGQTFALVLEITEHNGVAALEVSPSPPRLTGNGSVVPQGAPTPVDMAAYSAHPFVWLYEATQAGEVSFATEAEGSDPRTGAPVMTSTATASVVVETPPQLFGTLVVEPAVVEAGETVTLTLEITNAGGATVTQLAPSQPVATGTATMSLVSEPLPRDLPGTSAGDYPWVYRADTRGDAVFAVSAAGLDANSGELVILTAVVSNPLTVRLEEEMTVMISDPLADGSAFSFVFGYDGRIYLGPNRDGTGGVRLGPDGSALESTPFTFVPDVSGNVTRNRTALPLTSIGAAGCTANTPQCGPDNEDGRGLFAAGLLAGEEWLVIGGARNAGDLNYVYMTSDNGPALSFLYVDLSAVLGPQTRGISAMHIHQDRLYLGFPDTGGKRPYLLAIEATPSPPGLDALSPGDAQSLAADEMPGVGGSAVNSLIDSIIDFNGRLYVTNNGGWIRSTTGSPQPYSVSAVDWSICTPSATAYAAEVSVTTTKTADLEPRDKAVPMMASFGDRLFAGRNTENGPQLWACDPGTAGEGDHCDPDDWSLVGGNTIGNPGLTQLENPSNAYITLVMTTAEALYVGFDNAVDGIVIMRSSDGAPNTAADFAGLDGCPANEHPVACEGLGGNGLGDPSRSRILSAAAVGDTIFLVIGDGVGSVTAFRLK